MASHGAAPESKEPRGLKVLGTSDRNPGVRTVQVRRPELDEASFLPAVVKGLGITLRHFARNFFRSRESGDIETIQYPEEPIEYPERNRGLHRLMMRDDGAVRCVACMCCPTVCPANCITIVPAESDDKGIEKRPAVFEIDELRCVVCGLCVEACPCDAIRMDTGHHAKPVEKRGDGIMTMDMLLKENERIPSHRVRDPRSVAVQGGVGSDWRKE
jgi:NADH-quinone oxidoreductase subunit I